MNAVLLCLLAILVLAPTQGWAQVNNNAKRLETVAELIRSQRLLEAEKQLNIVLSATPNDPLAINMLGTVRAQQGNLDEAEGLFLRAIRIDNQLIGARMNLAYLYSLKKQPEKCVLQLEEVVRVDPANIQAVDMLAQNLVAQGQVEKAIAVIERAKKTASLPASLFVLLGDAYLKKGNLPQAEETYQFILGQQPEYTDAVLGLAEVSRRRGDANNALQYLARARKLPAESPTTLYRFAMVASAAGSYEEANNALQAAIKLKPDDASYYVALGNTWIKKPDLFEAEKAFRAALKIDPEDSQAQLSLGYVLLEQKKYSEAREWLEKSLQKDKTIPETFYYLGLIAQEQNEDQKAIDLFQNAVQLVPSYSFPHAALGASYLKLKNYPLAKQELELSIKLNPNDAKAHYNLAVLYARLKDADRAQEEMRIVEALKSKNKSPEKPGESPAPKPQ